MRLDLIKDVYTVNINAHIAEILITIRRITNVVIGLGVGEKLEMGKNNGNGSGYSIFHEAKFPPLPVGIVELYDTTLKRLVAAKQASIIHDGSHPYYPFDKNTMTESKKYKKSFEIRVKDYRVILDLIFDYRDGKNVGYVHVSEQGRKLLKENEILDIN